MLRKEPNERTDERINNSSTHIHIAKTKHLNIQSCFDTKSLNTTIIALNSIKLSDNNINVIRLDGNSELEQQQDTTPA